MIKHSQIRALALGIAAFGCSSVASAGEIKGPPPTGNTTSPPMTRISNGNSFCSYSGLNDTPDGQGQLGQPNYDPGGIAQSYGFFHHEGLYDPSDPNQRDSFAFPGFGCNPNYGGALNPNSQ
jgi:hypothetical protein